MWNYCSWVISTLMQLIRLVEGIECKGGRYISQEASFHHPYSRCYLFSFPWAFIGYQLFWSSYFSRTNGVLGVCLALWVWIGQVVPRLATPRSLDPHIIHIPFNKCSSVVIGDLHVCLFVLINYYILFHSHKVYFLLFLIFNFFMTTI